MLEDNLRNPSGVSYVMENRRTMARVFPDLFTRHGSARSATTPCTCCAPCARAAAPNVADPKVVVLTPGVYNSAYFEHSLLARQMGVELVEGRDLFCRDNAVYMRTTIGEQQVDVIYRRIDDEFLDPCSSTPPPCSASRAAQRGPRRQRRDRERGRQRGGRRQARLHLRAGDDLKYYLGEKPLLPNVDTFRCWLPEEKDHVLAQLDELVLKPVEGSGGYGIVFGPNASARELAASRRAIRDDPRGWIAQPVVQLSTVPTKVDDRLVPRHVDLRPFAVNDGKDVFVLPGGLTRVALPEGQPGGQLQPGRGQQGHLGARGHPGGGRRPRAGPPAASATAIPAGSPAAEHGPELTMGHTAATTATAGGGPLMLAPQRRVAVLDRPLVERADDTARILDVSVHQLLEDATVDADAASRASCSACSVSSPPEGDALDARSLTELVGYSADQPASIVSSVSSARENARGAREVVSDGDVGVPQRHLERRCPSGSATPDGWGRTRSSRTSRTAPRCSAASPPPR